MAPARVFGVSAEPGRHASPGKPVVRAESIVRLTQSSALPDEPKKQTHFPVPTSTASASGTSDGSHAVAGWGPHGQRSRWRGAEPETETEKKHHAATHVGHQAWTASLGGAMKFPPQTKPAAPGFCDLRQDRLLWVGVESGTVGGRGCSPRAAGGRPPPLPPTPAACSPLGLTPESFPR